MSAHQTSRKLRPATLVAAAGLAFLLPLSLAHGGTTSLKRGGKLRKEGTLDQAYCTYRVTSAVGKCTNYEVGQIVYVERADGDTCASTLYAAKGITNPTSACGLVLELEPQLTPEIGNTGRTLGGGWITF